MEANYVIKIFNLIKNLNSIELSLYQGLFDLSEMVNEIRIEWKRKLPYRINVIKSAASGHLKETAHSAILGDLLINNIIQKSFVETFVPECVGENFNVKVEIERIDVSLRNDKFFIIVENKVNGAKEQKAQIYRYVKIAEQTHPKERVFVIYLNPSTHNMPSNYSLDSDDESGKTTFDILDKSHLIIKSYKDDIYNWMIKCLNDFKKTKEKYLNSALIQYTDFLDDKFEISERYNDMKKEIKDVLIRQLKLNEFSTSEEKLKFCNEKISEIDELRSLMGELKNDIYSSIVDGWENELSQIFVGHKITRQYPTEWDISFSYRELPIKIGVGIENDMPWIGITNSQPSSDKKEDEEMMRIFKDGGLGSEKPNSAWKAWTWATFNDIIEKARKLKSLLSIK